MNWIKTQDRLPKENGEFLTNYKGTYALAFYDKILGAFYSHGSYSIKVDWWCEIIAPLEENNLKD